MTLTIDFDDITEEMQMEQEDILHLMTIYQTELQKDMGELEQFMSSGDWLLVKNKLHKMKGDAANLCLKALAETFAAMEQASLERDIPALSGQLDTANTLRMQFHSAFQEYSEKGR